MRACVRARAETYNVVFILKVGVVLLHGLENCLEGGNEVVEDGGAPCLALHALETASIDDSHLLEDGRLSALAGTCMLISIEVDLWLAGICIPSSNSLTSRSARFLSVRSAFSISAFFLVDSGSAVEGFRPKHMIAGAM